MLKVVAPMIIKKDKIDEFKKTARELIEKSNGEAGNVYYTLNQSTTNPQKFAMLECWKDEAALKTHMESEHFKSMLPVMGEMTEAPGGEIETFIEVEY
ncbi:MAG: antibiotic biosynthesis monooxygenase [Lachnospiraceae bacterium]|nr:antibiotic biosynthesis monooxygenase [Lachnospiraceae bacterium]